MSPKSPRLEDAKVTGAKTTHVRIASAALARLCFALCVLLAPSPTSRALAANLRDDARRADDDRSVLLRARGFRALSSQTQSQQPAPTPTPHVRPRTVGEKEQAAPPTPQTGAGAQQQRPGDATEQPAGSTRQQPTSPAPSQPSQAVDEDDVVRVDSNLVIIPASVVDMRGHSVTDLKADDFELRIDGDVKTIGDLSRAETPVHIALLFDNSASLSAAREFEKQAAVRFFQSVVRPIDRAAVYSISTTPTLSQPLTNDVSRLVHTVQNFGKPDGATALFDAVTQAADYLRPQQGRKVLLIVSDGTDTVSDASFEDAVNRALRAECQVVVVQTRQVEDPNLHDTVSEQRMYKLTEQTGGAVYVPQSVEDLDAVFTQISLDLSQQYLLSYYPEDERKDKFFRFISLRVKTRPNLRVRARKGFYPNGAQAGATSDNAQFSETLSAGASNEQTVALNRSAQSGGATTLSSANELASKQRRSGGNSAAPKSARDAANATRKIGPDGPDDGEEKPRASASADDSAPTFTLKAVASVPVTAPPTAPDPSSATTPAPTTTSATTPAPSPVASKSETDAQPQPSTPAPDSSGSDANRPAAKSDEASRPRTPVSGGVLNGKAVSLPKPAYPAAARNTGAAGKVVVEVTIDEHGKVVEARAVSGHPFLQQAAVAAARQARFTPTLISGEPVKVVGTISYTFTLQ